MSWDDERPMPKRTLLPGEDLEPFAVSDLEAHIVTLELEIARVRLEIVAKKKHAAAAAALFQD